MQNDNSKFKNNIKQKKVAIILINYKDYARRFLAECRDGLRRQDYPMDRVKIYLVDNASTDETREYLKKEFPEAVIIPRPDGNYSAANNAGIRQGMKDGCDYFVIVNMDVKLDPGWLSELVKAIKSDAGAGIAQSKVLLYPKNESEWQKPKINTLGNVAHFLGFGFTSHYLEADREIDGYPEITGYASGCSLIVKREVIEKVGLYNEEYYMYHDDFELSYKAKLAGFKLILAPKSVIYHKYEFSRSVKMVYYMERNRLLAIFSFYKFATIILILPALIIMDLGMLFYSFLNGMLMSKLKIYSYFLNIGNWRKILSERKRIQAMRVRSDREILTHFSGKIEFQEIGNPLLDKIVNPAFNLYWQAVKRLIYW